MHGSDVAGVLSKLQKVGVQILSLAPLMNSSLGTVSYSTYVATIWPYLSHRFRDTPSYWSKIAIAKFCIIFA